MAELDDRIEVRVIGAEDLPEVEGGECNPFCVVVCGGEQEQTSVVNGTSSPEWPDSQRMVFSGIYDNDDAHLRVRVMHKVLSGGEVDLGTAIVNLNTAMLGPGIEVDGWYETERKGRVRVKVSYFLGDEEEYLDDLEEDDLEEAGKAPNCLKGTVIRARGLVKAMEACASVKCGSSKFETKAARKSRAPAFDADFKLPATGTEIVMIKVKSKGFYYETLLGQAEIPVVEVVSGATKWCELRGPDNVLDFDRGQLEIQMEFVYDKRQPPLNIFHRRREEEEEGRVVREDDDDEEEERRALTAKEREEAEARREALSMMAGRVLDERLRPRMAPGDYQIQVHVIEARDLRAQDYGGTSDPYCRAKVLGKTKKTRVVKKVTSCVFDETLYFNFRDLKSAAIEDATVEIEVYDYDYLTAHDLIGKVSFDAKAIHARENHEFYRQWVGLVDARETRNYQGHLKVSVTVLGAGDDQKPHDLDREYQEEVAAEEEAGGDGVVLSSATVAGNLVSSSSSSSSFLVISVWGAEDVPATGVGWLSSSEGLQAAVRASFAGSTIQTSTIRVYNQRKTLAVDFLEELWIPVKEPVSAHLVHIALVHHRRKIIAGLSSSLDYRELPRDDGSNNTQKQHQYRWHNLYGAPFGGGGRRAKNANRRREAMLENRYGDEASTYRGRLLLSARVVTTSQQQQQEPHRKQIQRRRQASLSRPAIARYALSAFVVTGSEIPRIDSHARIVAKIGNRSLESAWQPNNKERGVVRWNEIIKAKGIELPVLLEEIPDVFIYLQRKKDLKIVSYARIPAAKLLKHRFDASEPEWHQLAREPAASPLAPHRDAGAILLQLGLALQEDAMDCPWDEARLVSRATDLSPFCVRVYVYQARDLPPSDANGLVDAYVKVRLGGHKEKTRVSKKTTAPIFYQTLQFHDVLPKDARYGPDVVVQIWDAGLVSNTPLALLHIPLKECPVISESATAPAPTWRRLQDRDAEPLDGFLLVAAALIRKRDAAEKLERPPDIKPQMRRAFVEVTFLGVRQLKGFYGQNPSSPYVRADVVDDVSIKTKPAKGRNATFAERKCEPLELPENPLFAPKMDVRVYESGGLASAGALLGACAVDLSTKMPWNSDAYVPPQTELFFPEEEEDEKKEEVVVSQQQQQRDDATSSSSSSSSSAGGVEEGRRRDDDLLFGGGGGDEEKDDDDDEREELLGAEDRPQLELEQWSEPPRGRSARDDGIGAFNPMVVDDLPPILEDVLYEEEVQRVIEEEAAAEEHQRGFLAAIEARLANATDVDAMISGEEKYKLSELDIEFPTQWTDSDYLKGRDWWLRQQDALELEHYLKTKPFETYTLYRGRHDPNPAKSTLRPVGELKAIVRILEEDPDLYEVDPFLPKHLLEPAPYCVRLYVIRGMNLQPVDGSSCDPYLRVKLGADDVVERQKSHKTRTLRPDFYETFEFFTTLPGPSILKLQVKDWNRFYPVHELVGETRIDVEDRWFHRAWQELEKKPVEVRNLKSDTSSVVQGQVQLWLDVRPAAASREPAVPLVAPESRDFEVRIVCWRSKEVARDMGDYYCQFWIGDTKKQKTDIHWRCQNGRASWNWRIKIPLELPLDSPEKGRLTVQLWDQDIIKWNDVIGEAQIDLYRWFLKAYRDQRSVQVFKVINDAIKKKKNDEMGVANEEDLLLDEEEEEEEEDDDDDDDVENPLLDNAAGEEADIEEGGAAPPPEDPPPKKKKKKSEEQPPEQQQQQPPSKAEAEEKDAAFLVKQLKDLVGLGDLDETAQWIRMTYHDKKRNRVYSRGSVAISIEILPKEEAELRPAGFGISAPNQNPVLPPRSGRLSFTLNPFVMLGALCGPKIATMICCCLCLAAFLFIWFYVGMFYEEFYEEYQAFESLA
ncbi:hypothetical protein CTAYLR_004010 [Chrysophaeum taylorii]|uniref:C2 domain-containing protein n=1 Tax=Chrysophaeum taylorii TaxID=2483200 RepID=A0AAD7XKU3_9STRA|nr:hypothetical protein CTAYLR_004010 [Chrysophaeum taylorii]